MSTLTLPVGPCDHAQGPEDARVTLVEYGDYECPHCARAHPVVRQIQRQMGDSLRLVFRNFPLSQMHPHAQHAAEAAEAAGAQGQFWPMHDMLFENRDELDDADLAEYAGEIGLDENRFEQELAHHAHAARVREDFLSGVKSGVNGTPTFFLNGVRHDGGWDYETLLAAVQGAAR